jgi:hypothetical protein
MITAKQYDALMTKLIRIEGNQEAIMNNQIEIVKSMKALESKTLVISDVNEQIEQLKKDVKSLQDEGVM